MLLIATIRRASGSKTKSNSYGNKISGLGKMRCEIMVKRDDENARPVLMINCTILFSTIIFKEACIP